MSTRLVILGLLREQPMYGYEIKQTIETYMKDWTSIAFGSIYFALDKLEEEGLIEKVAVEQQGNRPARSVYQVTQAGKDEFLQLLRTTWSDTERAYFSLDIGLFFLPALPVEEVKGYVQGRIARLEGAIQYLTGHREEKMEDLSIPPVGRAIFSHALVHFQAELAWTRELLAKLESGEYR